ncbi:MAG: secreted protein [Anaerolineae bacterium]|nr:MAG: secreted protein [Anaerolineae bacterium]
MMGMVGENLLPDQRDDLFFRWLGVGGIQLRWREQVLLIDPFLSRPSLMQVLLQPIKADAELLRSEIAEAFAILITHAHYDHLLDTPEIIRQTNASAYGSENVVKLLQASGIPQESCHLIHSGDRLEIGVFQIEVIEGKHLPVPFFAPTQLPSVISPPRRVWDYQMDRCFSFFISNTEPSILVWHSVEANDAVPAQILIVDSEIPFSAFGQLVQRVKPSWIIPIHWDDFFLPLSAPLKPFFRPPEKLTLRLGRLRLTEFVEELQSYLTTGRLYLPERSKEINLKKLT